MSNDESPRRDFNSRKPILYKKALNVPMLDEVLNSWQQGIFSIPYNIDKLASMLEFRLFAPDCIHQYAKETSDFLAIDMTQEIIGRLSSSSVMREPLLNLILDLSANIKKSKGTHIRGANEAIFNVYLRAREGSITEIRAESMIPTSGEFAERLAYEKLARSLHKQPSRQLSLPEPNNPYP